MRGVLLAVDSPKRDGFTHSFTCKGINKIEDVILFVVSEWIMMLFFQTTANFSASARQKFTKELRCLSVYQYTEQL